MLTTDDPIQAVVVDGRARRDVDPATLRQFLATVNEKYDNDIGEDFLDPDLNGVFEVAPNWVFAIDDAFATSPTRWTFDQ